MIFYFYLHTHWDREWYFTNETVKTLLQHNIDQYLQNPSLPMFYLDGQISLVVDYLKNASPENKTKFLKLLKTKKIITGPWYSQPDVFNSVAETIIRNIQITKKIGADLQIPLSETIYCPDTFGFGNNLPQIFKLLGFDNFIFWRGITHELKTDHFVWKGIDQTKINCYCLRFGYFAMHKFINWKLVSDGKFKEAVEFFIRNFENSPEEKHYLEMNKEHHLPVLFGTGHDQAPIYRNIYLFFEALSKKSKHQFKIKSHEDFFKEVKDKTKKNLTVYQSNLDYSYVSKIHRTIASTRYDFKKLFRDNELFLYHQLEPLQLWFKANNANYDIKKNQSWIQEICKMQAHDALGSCVADEPYLNNVNCLARTLNEMKTERDYLFRQISQNENLSENDLLIFNPMVNKNLESIAMSKQVFNKPMDGYIEENDYAIYILNSQKNNLIFKDAYAADVILINKKLEPLSFKKISTAKKIKKYKVEKLSQKQLKKYKNKYLLSYEVDCGDTYDFDPGNNPQVINLLPTKIAGQKINNIKIINLEFTVNQNVNQKFTATIIKTKSQERIFLKTVSKIKNAKISLLVNCNANVKYQNVYYDQTLACKKTEDDSKMDWKALNYLDAPLNAYRTNSFIKHKEISILTYGTNEFWIQDNFIKITLYRSVDFLGKANLVIRPGKISGLDSKKIKTDLAQMQQKELNFEFSIYENNDNLNQIVNSAYRQPMLFLLNSPDEQNDSLGKFIIETQKILMHKKIKLPQLENLFVASSWINYDQNLQFTITNFQKNKINDLAFNKTKILVKKQW